MRRLQRRKFKCVVEGGSWSGGLAATVCVMFSSLSLVSNLVDSLVKIAIKLHFKATDDNDSEMMTVGT